MKFVAIPIARAWRGGGLLRTPQAGDGSLVRPQFFERLAPMPTARGTNSKETERVMFLLGVILGVLFWPWQSWGLRTKTKVNANT